MDIVGLPDQLKQELKTAPPVAETKPAEKPAEPQKQVEKAPVAKAKPVEMAKPDEMVLNPKRAHEKELAREKKLKGALSRIKALESITDEPHPKHSAPAVLIKGNKVSKGSSLSGDAKESDQANYYDAVRDRLQDHWEIPIWFKNQGLSAKVQIYIDRSGHLHGFKFIQTSGNAQFDDAVKRTVAESQPFLSPPESIASTVLINGILVGFPL